MIVSSAYSFRLLSKEKVAKPYPEIKIEKIEEEVESDNKKRSFLKLAGMVGAGAIAASFLPKKTAEALVFGSSPTSSTVGVKNIANAKVNPATEDGNLATIKTNTDNLTGIKSQTDLLTFDSGTNPANLKVNVAAGHVGIQNSADQIINPATEETLTLIKNQTAKLTFDGNNLMITGGTGGSSSISIVGVKDTANVPVNPASDDSLVYLRRIVKLMESQGTVDQYNRQRVAVSEVYGTGASVALQTPRVTVANDSSIILAAGAAAIGSVTFGATASIMIGGYDHRQFIDIARSTYAMGIRNNLVFS